jgi:hypothetical protein
MLPVTLHRRLLIRTGLLFFGVTFLIVVFETGVSVARHEANAIKIIEEAGGVVYWSSFEHLIPPRLLARFGVRHWGHARQVRFSASEAGDDVAKVLPQLAALEEIDIDENRFSDECIESLATMQSLRTVAFYNTQVTQEGAARLRKALPKAQVFWGQDPG